MRTLVNNPFIHIAHKSLACLLVFCIVNMPLWAIENGDVVGTPTNATVSITDNVLTDVVLSDKNAIINWNNLDTVAGENLNYSYTGGSFAVLNRVAQQVNFNGNLNALGGHVFIMSSQGVILGSSAQINAARFTASGLNITDDNFLNGIHKFQPFEGGVVGNVENYATIDGVTDQVDFLGKSILNEGTISLPEGGVVVMTAGETVYLGEPDGKVVVEMTGIEGGNVTNIGEINAPEGKVILAAGDIYSIPIHPQLKVAELDSEGNPILEDGQPVYLVDKQPVRAETGFGTVEQSGTIHADGITGDGGSVILTAGDEVYLRSGSLTTANGGITADGSIGANGGEVITYAYDFGNLNATNHFENGALIEVKGGSYDDTLMLDDILQVKRGVTFDGGLAAINGNHIYFDGSIDAATTVDPYIIEIPNPLNPAEMVELPVYPEGGTLQIDPVNLAVVNGDIPDGGVAMDTFYEEQIEYYSNLGINLDLAADEMITVEYMADGEIWGGSGDILFRNVYDTGGIHFLPNADGEYTTMHTTAADGSFSGGNIFFIAGGEGIIAGDMKTDKDRNNKISIPGKIRLLTTNGGDMEVGSMVAERGVYTEISAISSGDLTVHGEVISDNRVIDDAYSVIGFARICLVAKENVYIDAEGGAIEVKAHGKIVSLGEIVICAGNDITIENLGRDGISATAQTSENSPLTTSWVDVAISAGAEQDNPATIMINGDTFDSTSDTLDLPVYLEAKASGVGGSLKVDPSNNETRDPGSESTWTQNLEEENNYDLTVTLLITDNQTLPMGDENSPCARCPLPEGLPPVPHVFWILDDIVNVNNKTGANAISAADDMLINDDNGNPLADGIVSEYDDTIITNNGGLLVPEYDGEGNIVGFYYTPPADATYVVDENDQTIAFYTDSFTYKAKDADGFESLNYATVTIKVKNNVPVAQPDEYTESHNIVLDVDGDPLADVITGVVPADNGDYDADEDALTALLVDDAAYGTVVLNADGTFTYTPDAGNTTGEDSFTYKVTDGYNQSEITTVSINLTNTDPVAQDDAYSSSHNFELGVTGDPIADVITGVVPELNGDYDPDNEAEGKVFDDTLTATLVDDVDFGTLVFNDDGTFTYTPEAGNGTGTDSFTYTVSDEYGGTSNIATVNITLTNADPVAQDDAYSNSHNLELDVTGDPIADVITGVVPELNGDYDPDNAEGALFEDTLTAALIDDVDFGTLVFNDDGTFTYTPDAGNTTGADSFTYTVSDEYGGTSNIATVNITLTNTDPVAQDDAYSNSHNMELDVTGDPIADVITGVVPELNGDYDPDNTEGVLFEDTLTATLVDDVDFGTLIFNEDGTFTYIPDSGNTTGSDSFTYTVSDEYGGTSNIATVNITLTNTDPVAQDDAYSNSHNMELGVTGDPIADVITGVVPELNGDYDPDNTEGVLFEDTLTATLVDDVDFGTLVFNEDGTFTYTPNAGNTTGADSFTYTVSDEYGGTSNTATVNITLTNQAPVAQPDGYTTDQDTPLVITIPEDVITGVIPEINGDTDPDNDTEGRLFDDTLSAILAGNGTTALGGTIVLNEDGSFTYTPPAGGSGVDSFTYYVNDGYDNSNTVTVTINVEGIPVVAPVAPLPDLEIPVLSGCPAEMAAAAAELGVNSDQLQVMLNSAMASNPNTQPCDACASLLTAAATLKQMQNNQSITALAEIFNTLAPIDAPYTPEVSASVETALARFREMDSRLAQLTDEEFEEYQQSAMANELVEAFVSYIAVLNDDLKITSGDPVDMVIGKYFEQIEATGNPNIGTYLIEKMESVRVTAEPTVALAE